MNLRGHRVLGYRTAVIALETEDYRAVYRSFPAIPRSPTLRAWPHHLRPAELPPLARPTDLTQHQCMVQIPLPLRRPVLSFLLPQFLRQRRIRRRGGQFLPFPFSPSTRLLSPQSPRPVSNPNHGSAFHRNHPFQTSHNSRSAPPKTRT